jgi:hypothetical protein
MSSSDTSEDRNQIRSLLQRINDAWLKGRAEDIPSAMTGCMHPEMVIRGPNFQLMSASREKCIQSYVDFVQQVKVKQYSAADTEIDLAGVTAIANYSWTMTYELNGQEYTETGYDVFALSRADGRWVALWRALLPASE